MRIKTTSFLALLLTALALAPGLAHLFELPNKIGLSAQEYLTVQQIYRGWALLGIVVVGALVANLVLAIQLRSRPRAFRLAAAAFLGVLASLAVFFAFTYPANRATANWAGLPEGWEALRRQWECAHATAAVLNLGAFVALILAVLAGKE